ncbi:hypothetical protein T4D_15142 [Trichinella pseudospiralis]|uniref:Uncharacterized protein n=1 Tax=Trichinella pseudospiralis TaxID=6337 RepID=A0A0V1FAA4_TRIPS|nr:hypothetical protein T4D_15142 [Trichinella pseudospiralis]
MIRHRYGDHYLHNGALEIIFRELQLFECILLIVIKSVDIEEQLEEQETYHVWIRRFCKSFISNYAVFLE